MIDFLKVYVLKNRKKQNMFDLFVGLVDKLKKTTVPISFSLVIKDCLMPILMCEKLQLISIAFSCPRIIKNTRKNS